MWEIVLLEILAFLILITHMSLFDRDIEITRLQVALDIVLVYAISDDFVPGPTHVPYQLGDPGAMMFKYGILAGDAADHLSAVSSRCSPADFFGFNDMHVVSALRQVQGRRDAGETCTYHTHIGIHGTGERREVGFVIDAGSVV